MYYICLMTQGLPADVPPPLELVGYHYTVSLDTLRGTLKWLVASTGAVIAALVAGTQLVDYSGRALWGVVVAALAVAVALILTLLFLVRTASILATFRPTATDLANAEHRAGAADPSKLLAGEVEDRSVNWILSRQTYLLGPFETVGSLLQAWNRSVNELAEHPDDGFRRQSASVLRERINVVEEAAQYRDAKYAFQDLLSTTRKWSWVFAAAVLAFALSNLAETAPPRSPANPVTKPTAVRIIFPQTDASVSPACRDRSGFAVGGTFDRPRVVVSPSPGCPARTAVGDDQGVLVIPSP